MYTLNIYILNKIYNLSVKKLSLCSHHILITINCSVRVKITYGFKNCFKWLNPLNLFEILLVLCINLTVKISLRN